MAQRKHTCAIRLAVEGGGQVKAELIAVGQSGEQSLKRIESAGERASGGLKTLGRQAELLRTGIRTLGGALLGVTTVGGLAALVDRSISAADAVGKTADKIGVGVEALQELRFAAKAAGIEQGTLDMALQRFTRRAAEAAQGTGEAKDALARLGIALRDQSGNLRRSEDLLSDVADAFARIEDPAERVRLAFKLFDSQGVALVNLLREGSGALEQMRERARSLGIVLDERLVRDAERARTELDTLAQVISANLTRAALEAAPVIADLSGWLADLAGKAGIAWERLFDAPEEKSLRTLRYELDLTSSRIELLQGRIQELRESPTRNGGNPDIAKVQFRAQGSGNHDLYVDDIYVCDTSGAQNNDFLGDVRIETLRPNADTAQADWTPSAGTDHYAVVDDAPGYDGADYVESDTVGHVDLWEYEDLGSTPQAIHAVQLVTAMQKTDAGTREARAVLKSGATTANGATRQLSTSWQQFEDLHEADPDTGAAWTEAGVNGLQGGAEVVT